jgi:hypothetical protein
MMRRRWTHLLAAFALGFAGLPAPSAFAAAAPIRLVVPPDIGELPGTRKVGDVVSFRIVNKDLFVSNGYRQDVTNLDYVAYLQTASQFGAERDRRARLLEGLRNLPEVKVPNVVFQNDGDLTFTDRTKDWGLDVATYANGAAYADLDGDGDLDLVVNNIDAPASVFVNHSERLANRNWLRVALTGPAGNRAGLGAQVTIHAGGARQYVEENPVRGYVSSVDPVLHFGLGASTVVDSAELMVEPWA